MTAFYKQSWFAPVASAATNFLFPSLGSAVGGAANSLLGGALSDGVANALGSAVVGGGIGAVSNGAEGALTGALAGGATRGLMDWTGYNQGLAGVLSNGSFAAPSANAITGGLRDSNIATTNGVTGGNATPEAAAKAAGTAAATRTAGAAGGSGSMFSNPAMIAGLALAGGLGSSMLGANRQQQQQGAPVTTTDPNMSRGLSQVSFNRTYQAPEGDMRRYGMEGGQHRFFKDNQLPVAAAEGGEIRQPRRVNTPTPDSAYGGRRAMWDGRYRGADYVDSGLGSLPQGPLVYGSTADFAQTVSPVQGVARQRNMGALEIIKEALRGDPDARHKIRGNPREYPRFEAEYARGGVAGPGSGRDDAIPAVLSDGEFVIDAETVALLGDGSSKEGARRLEEMRRQIRAHKGRALARGQISPNARPALAYAGGK